MLIFASILPVFRAGNRTFQIPRILSAYLHYHKILRRKSSISPIFKEFYLEMPLKKEQFFLKSRGDPVRIFLVGHKANTWLLKKRHVFCFIKDYLHGL